LSANRQDGGIRFESLSASNLVNPACRGLNSHNLWLSLTQPYKIVM